MLDFEKLAVRNSKKSNKNEHINRQLRPCTHSQDFSHGYRSGFLGKPLQRERLVHRFIVVEAHPSSGIYAKLDPFEGEDGD